MIFIKIFVDLSINLLIGIILERLNSKIIDVERLDRNIERSDDTHNWTIKATIRGENQPKVKVPKSKINPDGRPVICGKKSTVSEDNHARVEVRDQSLPSRQQGKEADIAQVSGKQLLSFLIFRMRGGAPGGVGNVGRQRGWVLWPPGWG